jgi:hypothetical protein
MMRAEFLHALSRSDLYSCKERAAEKRWRYAWKFAILGNEQKMKSLLFGTSDLRRRVYDLERT